MGGAVAMLGSDRHADSAFEDHLKIVFKENIFDSNVGGALHATSVTEFDVNSAYFLNNTQVAGMNGGAIASYNAGLVLDYATFTNNTIINGDGDGGQLYVFSNASDSKAASVSTCSFEGKQELTG